MPWAENISTCIFQPTIFSPYLSLVVSQSFPTLFPAKACQSICVKFLYPAPALMLKSSFEYNVNVFLNIPKLHPTMNMNLITFLNALIFFLNILFSEMDSKTKMDITPC